MKIIDVTLRESVFCPSVIKLEHALEVIRRLSEAGLDYIEIGYLKHNQGKSPFLNYRPDYIEKAFWVCGGKSKLSAMIHPSDFINSQIWDKKIIKKLSLIRITADGENFDELVPIINYFHRLDLEVSVNLLRSSHYSLPQCQEFCLKAEKMGAKFFYLADSNGHFLSQEVKKYITALKKISKKIEIGFHPHDNLGLAQINAFVAMKCGVDIVDSSILGFGKGAGNLRTELFPLLLSRTRTKFKGSIDKFHRLFNLARYFHQRVAQPNSFEEQYKFALYGLYDVDLDEDKEIVNLASQIKVKDYELAFIYLKKGRNLAKLKKAAKELKNGLQRI